jgi:hypothetical protein
MDSSNEREKSRSADRPRRADTETVVHSPREALDGPPLTPDALHDWIRRKLGYTIARRPIIPGHQAPFDYLCHSFFEGRVPGPRDASSPPARPADCIVWASRGSGKTWLGALATLLDLLFKPGIQARILGGSLDQSLRMRGWLVGFLEHESLAEVPRHIAARRITVFHDREKRIKSIAEVLAASQTSVRGTRVQKLRCDEVDLFHPEVWEAAQLVTRSMPCEGPWGDTVRGSIEALSTMHRPFGLMWTLVGPQPGEKTSVEHRAPRPMRPTFRWGALDVLEFCTDEHACETCILHPECQGRAKTALTPETGGHFAIADAVSQKARVAEDTWQSEMLCLRPSRSNTVYPRFDAATHVIGDAELGRITFERYIGGMDFGFRSEGALLLAGIDRDGVVVVLREHVRRGVVLDDYIAMLERWLRAGVADASRFEFLGVDPAGGAEYHQSGKSNIEVIRARGFKVRTRQSFIRHGIGLVQARLDPAAGPAGHHATRPTLLIHDSCARLIECMTRYCYDPDRPDDENPAKDGHDHAPDALRYMIVNLDAPKSFTVSEY